MTCYQSTNLPGGVTTTGRTSYKTEAECNQACKEGACCEGATCSVKPQCQCQGTGKVFKGVGTVCTRSGVCCKPSQLATATGGKQCAPIQTICDCTSAGDVAITTVGITCGTANCFQCPCTAKTDFPVSITVSCHARRPGTGGRTCERRPGDEREPVYFVDVDVTFTQTLYLTSASGTTCRWPSYQSLNSREFNEGGGVYANAVNGLEKNGVFLTMYTDGVQCRIAGYFFYLAFSPSFDGGIGSGDGVGSISGSVGGLVAGNDKFWDNAVGQVIQNGFEQPLKCYGIFQDQSTITIVSLNYLP